MKSIKQVVRSIGNAHSKKCVSTPGKWNSCKPCKNCGRPANYGSSITPPAPCCGAFISYPTWSDLSFPQFVQSDTVFMSGITCSTSLTFTANNITGNYANAILQIYVNNNPVELYNTVPYTVSVIDTDYIFFELFNIAMTEDICYSISLYNETCSIDYGIVLNNLCATI